MGKLSGKVALVTGGASGIGRAIVSALAAEGANIGTVDRNAAGARTAAEETAKLGVRAISASADVGDEAQMASAFGVVTTALGDVDILCNNAGSDTINFLDDMPLDMWDEMMRVNLRSVFLGTRLVLPVMRRKKWGRIINTASQLGHKGAAQMVHYCAAKAGVIGFAKSLAYEVARDGITVTRSVQVQSTRRSGKVSRRIGGTPSWPNLRSDGSVMSRRSPRPSSCSPRTRARTTSAPP
jgi:3-oxoacyl-[acyl-carrier protein] reductase